MKSEFKADCCIAGIGIVTHANPKAIASRKYRGRSIASLK